MKQLTLNSFKSESHNLTVDGSEPIIRYTVTDYEQTDSQVIITADYVSEEPVEMILESIDDEYLDEVLDMDDWVTVTGSCKFSVDIDDVEVDEKHLYITADDIDSTEGKIISVRLQDHKDYSDETVQKIESLLTDFYKENSTEEFMMIASYCRLELV